MFLSELKQELGTLKGAGPAIREAFSKLGVFTIADLLSHFPRDYEDRSRLIPLKDFAKEPKVYTIVEVLAKDWIGWGKKRTLKVFVKDDTATAVLVCFGRAFLERSLTEGSRFVLSGAFQYRYNEIQSSAFELEALPEGAEIPKTGLLPIYPLSSGLSQGAARKLIKRALQEYAQNLEDELPESLRARETILSMRESLEGIHSPQDPAQLEGARKSLIYRELFLLELSIGRKTMERQRVERPARKLADSLRSALIARLPFELTEDQIRASEEIREDMESKYPMARLLQGDVGSGKTLVAFLSALVCIEAGEQVALMAPTELLARQHAENAAILLEPLGVRLAFLSGNVQAQGRGKLLEALAAGEIDLVIGTHALFSRDVLYKNLSLVIVDEQHRFGVVQRLALSKKGSEPDVLLMTATPIPRTLALTVYGDLSISNIKTMPKGRLPVRTHLAKQGNEGKVYEWVRRELASGRQAYFVYPLIEQSEKLDLKDAESMLESLKTEHFPGISIGLIHSRLDEDEKRLAMARFCSGELKILVATSVVEVGVDVPNASCIVIEHAERFGLSALHQLRGRVGRSVYQSYAFLVYSKELTEDAKKRLKIMLESNDGFVIAEEDLKIRGPGELSGIQQSGSARLKIADIARDADVLVKARSDAFSILKADSAFLQPENSSLRELFSRSRPHPEGLANQG